LDLTKESPKTVIYDSTPNPKNVSNLLNDTLDKQNSKMLDSPPKKFLDPLINQSYNNNNSVKTFNNNSSSSSSFNSQSPIEKVHLSSVGLSNIGNTCFMYNWN
jgi:ubiquitin C-terminal hydrolase